MKDGNYHLLLQAEAPGPSWETPPSLSFSPLTPKHLPGRLVLHSEVSTRKNPPGSGGKCCKAIVARPPFFSPTWEDSDEINNCHLLDVYSCQAGCSTFLSHVTYCISLRSPENHNVYIYDTLLSLVNRQENTEVRSCFKVPQTRKWGTPLTCTLKPSDPNLPIWACFL